MKSLVHRWLISADQMDPRLSLRLEGRAWRRRGKEEGGQGGGGSFGNKEALLMESFSLL